MRLPLDVALTDAHLHLHRLCAGRLCLPFRGGFTVGKQFQLDTGWDETNDGYGLAVTDDDAVCGGDLDARDDGGGMSNAIGAASGQSAVVTNAAGAVVSSGRVYLESGYQFVAEFRTMVTVHEIEIGGALVGYVADGPIQPGNTYTVDASTNPSVTNGVIASYSDLHRETYDEDIANTVQGTASNDTLTTDLGDDTVQAGAGNASVDGGALGGVIGGGTGHDTI